MNACKLVHAFFTNPRDYIKFLASQKGHTIASTDATWFVELSKKQDYFLYKLTWLNDGRFVGDYTKLFRAAQENIDTFNKGCKILAEPLSINLKTNDLKQVSELPPAFGDLSYVKYKGTLLSNNCNYFIK